MGEMILTPKQLELSRKPAGSFRDNLEFRKIVCNICNLWYFIYRLMNKILFAWHGSMTDSWDLAVFVCGGGTGQITAFEMVGYYSFTTSEEIRSGGQKAIQNNEYGRIN